jgi:hypothetical protein
MENFENKDQNQSTIISNNEIKGYLIEITKWGKFLAIVGYIGMGILILVSVFMMFGLSKITQLSNSAFPMGILGLVYILIAVVYFFPIYYLHMFSVQTKKGLTSQDINTLTSGFQNLKSLFKFMGIFTIIILSLYALILLIAIPTAIMF